MIPHTTVKYKKYCKNCTYYWYSNKWTCRKNLHGKCHPTHNCTLWWRSGCLDYISGRIEDEVEGSWLYQDWQICHSHILNNLMEDYKDQLSKKLEEKLGFTMNPLNNWWY